MSVTAPEAPSATARAPSGLTATAAGCPRPEATVVMVPVGSTRRIVPLPVSAIHRDPWPSVATPAGRLRRAERAGPPSPPLPQVVPPATGVGAWPGATRKMRQRPASATQAVPSGPTARPRAPRDPPGHGLPSELQPGSASANPLASSSSDPPAEVRNTLLPPSARSHTVPSGWVATAVAGPGSAASRGAGRAHVVVLVPATVVIPPPSLMARTTNPPT